MGCSTREISRITLVLLSPRLYDNSTVQIRIGITQWTCITMTNNGIKQVLEKAKRKHWKQFQKETFAAICGAILYHTWRARN
ncbi:hypothetical protein H5410_035974 [Solanum commersonii]|uniref:Uncharacterized protein n=1 Tax=Solanum commersonii TaxID=4109 RepID=A0A9J5Y6R9_SOLCO|nr:hypothetical protein H5410_035974 [Solanum commersonii]